MTEFTEGRLEIKICVKISPPKVFGGFPFHPFAWRPSRRLALFRRFSGRSFRPARRSQRLNSHTNDAAAGGYFWLLQLSGDGSVSQIPDSMRKRGRASCPLHPPPHGMWCGDMPESNCRTPLSWQRSGQPPRRWCPALQTRNAQEIMHPCPQPVL
jgi:hypothetical protein